MLQYIINALEAKFPGSKSIIDTGLVVLKSEHDVIFAVINSLESYIPGSGTAAFLEALKSSIDALVALQNAKLP